MPAYTALLTVNMVFEWHRSVEEMAFIFDFWLPRDFARAMENGGRIASPLACRSNRGNSG